MTELFPPASVSSDSPRLRWIKRHKVQILFTPQMSEPWSAWSRHLVDAIDIGRIGFGTTEDQAIVQWACRTGIRLWNEETLIDQTPPAA